MQGLHCINIAARKQNKKITIKINIILSPIRLIVKNFTSQLASHYERLFVCLEYIQHQPG